MYKALTKFGFAMFGLLIIVGLVLGAFAFVAPDSFISFLNLPDEFFCGWMPNYEHEACDTSFPDEQIIFTRITERTVLDLGKFEQGTDLRAERTTVFVTHSMRMRGTVNVTMGMNLAWLTEEDITVDNEERTITIALPPVQNVECFITEREFYDRFCIEVCDDLENDLERRAIDRALESDELETARTNAYELAQIQITGLVDIANLSDDPYTLRFVTKEGTPPNLPATTCPAQD